MIKYIRKIASLPDCRKRIMFTLLMLLACRLGAYIPVPGIDAQQVVKVFKQLSGGGQNIFQLVDMFTGGAFASMTVVALGVMPYITVSIILQIFVAIIPSLQRDMKENPDASKKKIGKWTRVLTLILSFLYATGYATQAISMNAGSMGIIYEPILRVQAMGIPWLFYLLFSVTMTTGTVFLMWVGEQITERGIGNGMSMIIALGIISSLPSTLGQIIAKMNLDSQLPGQLTFSTVLGLMALFFLIVLGTILIIEGIRKIPIQYARKSVLKDDESNNSYVPLKINYAGVIPVIFASSILMFIASGIQFLAKKSPAFHEISLWLIPGTSSYLLFYVFLIIFLTYFWTSTQFNPDQIAADMKRNGAFIPGVKAGKQTEEYIDSSMNKITLLGALFLALIATSPTIVSRVLHIDYSITQFFGGTSLLILVGVILDTTKQINSHLMMNQYDGFLTKQSLNTKW